MMGLDHPARAMSVARDPEQRIVEWMKRRDENAKSLVFEQTSFQLRSCAAQGSHCSRKACLQLCNCLK